MKLSEDPATLSTTGIGTDGIWHARSWWSRMRLNGEFRSVGFTFLTTLTIFGIFLIQGILIARILLPAGRGEFGTAIFFPRDVLLYAGLLGGIEIVNAYASRGQANSQQLKYAAARLGLLTGCLTGIVAAAASCLMLWWSDSWYLLPFCLFCCLFVPLEHIQLTVSAVDRGKEDYSFYNWNRLLFALSFPLLVVAVYACKLPAWLPLSDLSIVCGLFFVSRIVGLAPTFRGLTLRSFFDAQDSLSVEAGKETPANLGSAIRVPTVGKLLKEGRGYAASMLATEIFERLDIILILLLSASMTQRGFYFVAVPVAALLTVAPNALGVFTFNAGADRRRHVTLKTALTLMLATAAFQVVACLLYAWLMPWLIINLYRPDFANSVPYALWLLPACAIKGYLQAADGYLKGRGRPMIGVYARAISALVMLAFVVLAFSWFQGPDEQRLLFIPMSACVGQALSLVVISTAVIIDVQDRDEQFRKSQIQEVT